MTTGVLTQNEIDALLRAKSAPAPATPARVTRPVDAQLYDFRRPNRLSKEKLRTLEAMYERMGKSVEAWLRSRLRGQSEFQLLSVEQYSFGEFVLSLPTPCASYTFDIGKSGGLQGIVDVGQEISFILVDRLFGGSGAPAFPNRNMTPIERMVVRLLAERVVHAVAEIWREYVDLELSLSGFESIPEILRAANREDPVVVANFQMSAADRQSLVVVCLPCAVVEKFFTSSEVRRVVNPGSPADQAKTRGVAESTLRATRVPVFARMPSFAMTLREIAALRPDAVIPTGIARGAELDVFVAGSRRYRGTVGRLGGHLGIQVTGAVEDPSAPQISANTP